MKHKIEFTQKELQILYAACISYGNGLRDVIKKIENCDQAVDLLDDAARDGFKLARKIAEYMEEA